jgi:hypothetical protein
MQVSHPARLLGTHVYSADQRPLGRIGAVYVPDGATQPLLVAFPADSAHPRIAPLFGAELTANGLVLSYPQALVDTGPTVDPDVELSVGEIGSVLKHYSPGVRIETQRPITERMTAVGDVGFVERDVHGIPAFPYIGDEDLPPIVVTKPGLRGPRS